MSASLRFESGEKRGLVLAALARDQIPVGRPALRPRTPALSDLALKARQMQTLSEAAQIRRRENKLAADELHARIIRDSESSSEAIRNDGASNETARRCPEALALLLAGREPHGS